MNQVVFYVLKPSYTANLYKFACRLIEQLFDQKSRIYVNAGSDAEANYLDRLLWTFRGGSFVPHGLIGNIDNELTPVALGSGSDPGYQANVLINLAATVPEFFNRFPRVVEIIDQDPQRLQLSREHYKWYKEQGCILKVHDMV